MRQRSAAATILCIISSSLLATSFTIAGARNLPRHGTPFRNHGLSAVSVPVDIEIRSECLLCETTPAEPVHLISDEKAPSEETSLRHLFEYNSSIGNVTWKSLTKDDNSTDFVIFLQNLLGTAPDLSLLSSKVVDTDNNVTKGELRIAWEEQTLLASTGCLDTVLGYKRTFQSELVSNVNRTKRNFDEILSAQGMIDFINQNYAEGVEGSRFDPTRSFDETCAVLKKMLVWFKEAFPYYRDTCHACGCCDNNSFLGYVRSNACESLHKAHRTELYYCMKCKAVTRFPRYLIASRVLETKRGRCGEYSILMFHFLEALGYNTRWIVDWADHVWVEVLLSGQWIHMDPCEASINEPLLYEGWGKKQTYIMAISRDTVLDVTHVYTSNFTDSKTRREVNDTQMHDILAWATGFLRGSTTNQDIPT